MTSNEQTEEEYLAAYDPSGFPPVGVTADVVLLNSYTSIPEVLLIKRGNHPYKGRWALPGGFMDPNETLRETAARELKEETGVYVSSSSLVEVGSFSGPRRDPRMRIVSVAFLCVVDRHPTIFGVLPGDDAVDYGWYSVQRLPELAFDHGLVIDAAYRRACR